MGVGFYEIFENNMKIIEANFKIAFERIESLEARLMKLEKNTGAPNFGQMQDDGETES